MAWRVRQRTSVAGVSEPSHVAQRSVGKRFPLDRVARPGDGQAMGLGPARQLTDAARDDQPDTTCPPWVDTLCYLPFRPIARARGGGAIPRPPMVVDIFYSYSAQSTENRLTAELSGEGDKTVAACFSLVVAPTRPAAIARRAAPPASRPARRLRSIDRRGECRRHPQTGCALRLSWWRPANAWHPSPQGVQ